MANRRRDSRVSSSQMDFNDDKEVFCRCNQLAPMVTSWTKENPGRRFYGCCKYKNGGCGFFMWYDDPLPKRAKELLISIRNSEKKLVKENEMLKQQLVSVGISFDEVKSTSESQREIGDEICSSESHVVDKAKKTGYVGEDELVEQLMKMTVEVDSLNNKNKRLKQKSDYNKKAKGIYKLLLIVSCVGYVWMYWSFIARCNATWHLSLP